MWSSGNKYEGEWREDQMEGEGVFEFATGGKYTGGFVNGLLKVMGRQATDPAMESHTYAPWAFCTKTEVAMEPYAAAMWVTSMKGVGMAKASWTVLMGRNTKAIG